MHYTISYKGLHGAAKRAKAVKDTEEYLGRQAQTIRDQIQAHLRAQPTRAEVRHLSMIMGIAGVQGYPAKAFVLDCAQRNKPLQIT